MADMRFEPGDRAVHQAVYGPGVVTEVLGPEWHSFDLLYGGSVYDYSFRPDRGGLTRVRDDELDVA